MSDVTKPMNKREQCVALIEAGGATKASLLAALDTTDKSLASLFALIRLTGKFPLKNADDTFYIGTQDEFDAAKATRTSAPSTPRSPIEVLEAAQKREDRASKVLTTIKKRLAEDGSRENELRVSIAESELELSSILLGKAQTMYNDADPNTRDEKTAKPAAAAPKGKGRGKKAEAVTPDDDRELV